MRYISRSMLRRVFRKRDEWSKKGDFGKLAVVGGSEIYSGAPYLVAMVAYRTGVDVVHVISPKRAVDIIASFSPEMITHPINTKFFTKKHASEVIKIIDNTDPDALVIGNGMGRNIKTVKFVKKIL